ncbi:hypothetical protein KC355_g20003 [Hortaea werneckii]|nr:hypothetical protein KC355_g20003 [Hortaea werneckii]
MAYDQSSAYEPPRRAYMGHMQQQHQWAPSHGHAAQGYNKQDAYAQHGYGPQYGEVYGAHYPQGQNGNFAQVNNYHQPNASSGENIASHPFTIINIYTNRLRDSQMVRNSEMRRSTNTKCPVNVTTTLDTSNAPVDPLRQQMVSQ